MALGDPTQGLESCLLSVPKSGAGPMKARGLPPPGCRAASEQHRPIGGTSRGTQEAVTWPSGCGYVGMETVWEWNAPMFLLFSHLLVLCYVRPGTASERLGLRKEATSTLKNKVRLWGSGALKKKTKTITPNPEAEEQMSQVYSRR